MQKDIKDLPTNERTDLREQLFNGGLVGTIEEVSIKVDEITTIRGILFDLDCCLLNGTALCGKINSPQQLYDEYASHWLGRHPVLAKAEVRDSGKGLHVILWPSEPIELADELDRERWKLRVKIIQGALPIDSGQPGIEAKTRPIASINSKNGREVTLLKSKESVDVKELLGLVEDMCRRPFKTTAEILLGGDNSVSCPRCCESRLATFDTVGRCYKCGKLDLLQLYDLLLNKQSEVKEVLHAN